MAFPILQFGQHHKGIPVCFFDSAPKMRFVAYIALFDNEHKEHKKDTTNDKLSFKPRFLTIHSMYYAPPIGGDRDVEYIAFGQFMKYFVEAYEALQDQKIAQSHLYKCLIASALDTVLPMLRHHLTTVPRQEAVALLKAIIHVTKDQKSALATDVPLITDLLQEYYI
jgi:hypothetical protein